MIENAEFNSDAESSDEEQPVGAGQVGCLFTCAPNRSIHCTSLQVRVAWYPKGTEEVVSEKNVHLADRSLMPGDIVRCACRVVVVLHGAPVEVSTDIFYSGDS